VSFIIIFGTLSFPTLHRHWIADIVASLLRDLSGLLMHSRESQPGIYSIAEQSPRSLHGTSCKHYKYRVDNYSRKTRTPIQLSGPRSPSTIHHDEFLCHSYWNSGRVPFVKGLLRSTRTDLNWSGARFTKYLTPVLRLSYGIFKVTIDLRRTSILQNILPRTQGSASVRFTRKIVRSSKTVFAY